MRWTAEVAVRQMKDRPKTVSDKEFQERVKTCETCPARQIANCTAAGRAMINVFAAQRVSTCPERRWTGSTITSPQQPDFGEPTIYPKDCRQADAVFFLGHTPAPGWWDTKGRHSVELLANVGISAACATNPNDATLPEFIERLKPKVIINRAMLISPITIRQLASRFPQVKFIAMNHSSYPFLLASPRAWRAHTEFFQMAESMANCYVGTPDERNDLTWIRPDMARKLLWIPNSTEIPDWKPREMGKPPVVSLIAAGRPLKNLPNQLAGLAMANRRLRLRGIVSVRGKETLELIKPVCRDLGLKAEFPPWKNWREYQRSLDSVDVCLQSSFTESFNYVGLEHMLRGAAVVGSPALRFLPREWQVNPDSARDISDGILSRLGNWYQDSRDARKIAVEFATKRNRQFQECLLRLLGS